MELPREIACIVFVYLNVRPASWTPSLQLVSSHRAIEELQRWHFQQFQDVIQWMMDNRRAIDGYDEAEFRDRLEAIELQLCPSFLVVDGSRFSCCFILRACEVRVRRVAFRL